MPADDAVGLLVGIGQIAHRPVFRRLLRFKGEGLGLRVPLLQLHFGKIHCPGVHPGRGAGLEAAHGEAKLPELLCQGLCRGQAVRPLASQGLAHDGASVQIGAGGDDHRPAAPDGAGVGGDGADFPVLHADGDHLRLLQVQVLLPLQGLLHHRLVASPIRLGPERVDRRSLPQIQHPVLDAGLVRRPGHLAAQGVQLPHQMALAGAADGRVAGHVAHAVQVHGEAQGLQSQPRRGQGRLDTGVSRPDHRDVAASRLISSHSAHDPSEIFFLDYNRPGAKYNGAGPRFFCQIGRKCATFVLTVPSPGSIIYLVYLLLPFAVFPQDMEKEDAT